jgi:hypothetical protein
MAIKLETSVSLAVELEKMGRLDTPTARKYIAYYIEEFIPSAKVRVKQMGRMQKEHFRLKRKTK